MESVIFTDDSQLHPPCSHHSVGCNWRMSKQSKMAEATTHATMWRVLHFSEVGFE